MSKSHVNSASAVIDKFGGLRALATALGHKHVSTVQGWRDRETIPSRRIPEIMQAGKEQGVDLSLSDFFGGLDK